MKRLYLAGLCCMLTYALHAQPSYYKEPRWPEADSAYKYYTVKGERHGPSFFKKYRFPEVEYEPGEKLTFDRYHTPDVIYAWYRRWSEKYPDLTELYVVAHSYE